MTARRAIGYVVLTLCAVAAFIAGARALDGPSEDPVHQVAGQLSCPDCAGQSVAESNSPVAESMRSAIAAQIADGRTPDQVLDWFVDRYGPDVVRAQRNGIDVLLWAAPAAVAITTAGAAVYTMRRRSVGTPNRGHAAPSRRRAILASITAVVVAMVVAVGVAGSRLHSASDAPRAAPAATVVDQPLALARSMETQGNFAAAADLYREAAAMRPDPAIRLRLAFALLRTNRAAEALPIAQQAQAQLPSDPDALLILGLVQRADGKPEAEQTLSRFLEAAPDHPAADQVRAVLEAN